MTRRQQIESLFQQALQHDPAERDAWLREACDGNSELQREVASLLANHQNDAGSASRAAGQLVAGPASLEAGQRLGPYEIVASLGAGGMGKVYRARDTRLKRDVAIKVCGAQFSDRFEREARVIASLNHPNICHLHDVGANFLVMELVEGETLSGPLPVETALNYARQIAEALEAAHEKGVVHRDLKPANVKVTPAGVVKVLDFGLAKAAEESKATGNPGDSPTMTTSATHAGMILGTAAYMSPEQARGAAVDKRTDIWAFGCVLYEMLTGRQAFGGDTTTDILSAVLKEEPDWNRVPAKVQPLLRRCLMKDPKCRLRDAADVRLLLEDIPEVAPVHAPASRGPRVAYGTTALFLLTTLLLLLFGHSREKPLGPALARFTVQLPDTVTYVQTPRISPDGRHLAFAAGSADGRAGLWVRDLESLDARALPGTDNAAIPFWSPDSRFIAFGAAGKLKKIAAHGGAVQTLCDAPDVVLGGDWNREGTIIFGGARGSVLLRVPEAGGAPTAVTALDRSRDEENHAYPSFLPDGRHFIYLRNGNRSGLYLGSLDVKPDKQDTQQVVAALASGAYVPSTDPNVGNILFVSEGALMAQAFDNRRLRLTGEPVPLVEQLLVFRTTSNFSASSTNVLAYRSGSRLTNELMWIDRQGSTLGGPVWEPGDFSEIALSNDGTRLAVCRRDPPGQVIWLLDLARGASSQLTFQPGIATAPVWSPDGRSIVFASGPGGVSKLLLKAVSGAGDEESLLESSTRKNPSDWSKDGRFLLYTDLDPKTKSDLWVLPEPGSAKAGDRKPTPYLRTDANESQGKFAPDNHWVAYVSDESGRPEVYVQPFPALANSAGKWKVSRNGGIQPRWRRDGRELFYMAPDRRLMTAEVTTTPNFRASVPRPLFQARMRWVAGDIDRYDVTADGKRFLVNTDTSATDRFPITVLLNWTAALNTTR